MKIWTKILPYILVEYLSKKHLQIFLVDISKERKRVVSPYKGVYIEVHND